MATTPTITPPLPEGFSLGGAPPLPPGFSLGGQPAEPVPSDLAANFHKMVADVKDFPQAVGTAVGNAAYDIVHAQQSQSPPGTNPKFQTSGPMQELAQGAVKTVGSMLSGAATAVAGDVAGIGLAGAENLGLIKNKTDLTPLKLSQDIKSKAYQPSGAGKSISDIADVIWGKSIGAVGEFAGKTVESTTGSKFAGNVVSDVTQFVIPERLGAGYERLKSPKEVKPTIDLDAAVPTPELPSGYELGKYNPPVEPTVSSSFDLWRDEVERLQKEATGYEPQFAEAKPEPQSLLTLQDESIPQRGKPNETFQGGPGQGLNFPLRQEVLDTPELKTAIQTVIGWHQELGARIAAASEKERPGLLQQQDNLVEKFAEEMKKYGITKKSDAYGRAIYDQIPQGLWQELRVKMEQQNSRQFAGLLTKTTDKVKVVDEDVPGPGWLRKVQAGVEHQGYFDDLAGFFPDKAVPIIQGSRPIVINGAVKHGLDVQGTLAHIMENSENPVLAEMARKLHGLNLDVSMYLHMDADKSVALGTDTNKNVMGNYILGSKLVNLAERGLTERVVVHELMHAATSHAILGGIKNPMRAIRDGKWEVDPNHPLAKEIGSLINIWKDLRQVAAEHHFEDFLNRDTGNWLYGLTSPLEMISEIGVNPRFMKWVNQQVEIKGGQPITSLGSMREAIKSMLGTTSETALDHIFFHTDQVANAYAAFPAIWDQFYKDVVDHEVILSSLNNKVGITGVPGLEAKEWLQEPEPFDRAKETILKEKDGGSTMTGQEGPFRTFLKQSRTGLGKKLTPGYVMAKELSGSTMIQNVGRIMTNAEKRADMFIEHNVEPIERAVGNLKEQNRANVQAVLLKELTMGGRFTSDQLVKIGLNDKEINAYNATRQGFDNAIQRINEIRQERNLKPISPLDAYHAARWSGGYRADIVDQSGKKIWAVAEKSYYDRQQAVNWILKQHPELKIANNRFVNVGQKVNSLQAGYLEMMDFLDRDDPRTQALKSTFEEMMGTTTENVAGQERHFKVKTGVRGYMGDRPWAKKNATDFFDEQVKYLEGAAKWTEFQDAFEDATKYTTDQNIRDSQPNNVGYAEDYIKHKMGFGSNKLVAAIENSVAHMMGLSPGTLNRIISVGKKVFYPLELAVKLPFIEISLLQHGFAGAQHAMLDAKGYKTKGSSIIDGIRYGTQHALLDAKEFGLSANPNIPGLSLIQPFTGHWAAAREYAHANKILDQNPLMEAMDIRSDPIQHKIENIANFTTAITEKVARGWTFYGLVSHLANSGKFDLANKASLKEMFRMAEESTEITMADYRATERSMMFNQMGLLGRAAAALKTYPTNMMGQLMLYSKEAGKGNYKPLTYFLAMQMAVGGLRGMFAVDDIDAVWSTIKRHLPVAAFEHVKDWGVKKWMAYNLNDLLYHGPISAMTGNNISVQGSMGRVIPGLSAMVEGNLAEAASQVFPSVTENFKTLEAVYGTVAGSLLKNAPPMVPKLSPNELNEAYYETTPTGLKGALRENALPGIDNPNFHAPGQPDLMLNPHKLEEGEYRRNAKEHEIGKLGFVSPREQRFVDLAHAYREMNAIMDDHRKEVVRDLKDYALHGNGPEVARLMSMYYKLGGDPNKVGAMLGDAAFEKISEMRQRAAIDMTTSNNPTKVMNARDFLQALTP